MRGRKSLKEEIQVIRYMTELSTPTFDYLKLCITSGDKEDKQWATEQMMKLYVKAIPQELSSDPDNPLVIEVAKAIADKNDINPSPEPNSGESSAIQSS